MYGSKSKLNVPAKFIAIQDASVFIPQQGHGYDSYTHHYEDIHRFKDEVELKEWLKEESNKRFTTPKPYKIYKVEEVKVDTEITISLS